MEDTRMRKIEAKFRIVTPLFMSGADQHKAELRVPSIKGALRFWWRALGRKGSVDSVRKAEARLFGSSDQEVGQSKVLMSLTEKNITTQKIRQKWTVSDWRSYIGYGLSEKAKDKPFDYIEAGSHFKLELVMKGSISDEEMQQTFNALKAIGLIGGLGSRSRNGWGSVVLDYLKDDGEDKVIWKGPANVGEYRTEITKFLSMGKGVDDLPDYTAFSKGTRIEVGFLMEDAQTAQKQISELYKDYVKGLQRKEEREAFGLPRKKNMERRGSPLILHIHEIENGAVPVVSFFPAKFLPNKPEPPGGYRAIERFLDQLSQGAKQ